MPPLKCFFNYYGGKRRLAASYPPPAHPIIVEPFAGGAGYSLQYADRDVVLVEKHEPVAEVWRYLTRVSSAEILALPLLERGQTTDTLPPMPQEALWLIQLWCSPASPGLRKTLSRKFNPVWGERVRQQIASQVESIRHWTVICGSYEDLDNGPATWFIDPPYCNSAGRCYPKGAKSINYAHLGAWCRDRLGQTIVCENAGADWLPFVDFRETHGKDRASREVIWTQTQ